MARPIPLDTSAATLQRNASRARPPPPLQPPATSPTSHWSPPSPTSSPPESPIARIRRSISNAISPVSTTFRRRSIQPTSIPGQPFRISEATDAGEPLLTATPLQRFRLAGQRVIQMNKLRRAMLVEDSDPTLRIRRPTLVPTAYASQRCTIDIVDYGIAHHRSTRLGNHDLAAFLGQKHRPAAKHVRWIDVSGISWDVANTLAMHYDLHPLSVEDMFGGGRTAPSKVDYYPQHVFIRALSHIHDSGWELCDDSDPTPAGKQDFRTLKALVSSAFGMAFLANTPNVGEDGQHSEEAIRRWQTHMTSEQKAAEADQALVDALKGGRRVRVQREHVFIFLRRDGTVISFHSGPIADQLFRPISRRIERSKSILRLKPDASLLVHALIDEIVEAAFSVIDAFHTQSLEFERDILLNPTKTSTMRDLHAISADIRLTLSTLAPLKIVIKTLRYFDVEKCIAMLEDQRYALRNKGKIQGFMSGEAKMYLTDVDDHLVHITSSLENFSYKTDRLLKYAFEMTSNNTASTIQQYTLLVVCFNPMIILVMYFGMNFQDMPSVQTHNEGFFWLAATPLLVAITAFVLWQTSWWKYLKPSLQSSTTP